MDQTQEKHLPLRVLEQRIAVDRSSGGLIYIKEVDGNGQPLNFKVIGSLATSGKWAKGLKSRPIEWLLVYQRLEVDRGRVWVGDHDRTRQTRDGAFVFHLSKLAGPLIVHKSFSELVGKREPQNPIYLSSLREESFSKTASKTRDQLADDIAALHIKASSQRKRTEVKQLILARLGQGKFRDDVLAQWNDKCAVTGCSVLEIIRASHIKPWHKSDSATRLNPRNGIPLIANLDALFDGGLITFSNMGNMLVSKRLRGEPSRFLGLPTKLRKTPNREQRIFLRYHRKHVYLR